MTVRVDVHLGPADLHDALRRRRASRAHRDAEGPAAEVVLRRPRLAALRRDHPARRVLPDPRRAVDPRWTRADEIAAASGADTLIELGSGTSEKTRLLLDALARAGQLQPLRPVRRERDDAARRRARRSPRSTPASTCTRSSATSSATSASSRAAAAASSRSSAARSATSRPRRAPSSWPTIAAGLEPGDSFLLGTDLVKDAGRLVAAYDDAAGRHRGVQQERPHVINRELDADFDLDALRPRRQVERRRRVDRDVARVHRGADREDPRPRPRRRVRRRRADAHRDLRQVPPGRHRGRARGRRPGADQLVDRRRRRLRPQPLHPLASPRGCLHHLAAGGRTLAERTRRAVYCERARGRLTPLPAPGAPSPGGGVPRRGADRRDRRRGHDRLAGRGVPDRPGLRLVRPRRRGDRPRHQPEPVDRRHGHGDAATPRGAGGALGLVVRRLSLRDRSDHDLRKAPRRGPVSAGARLERRSIRGESTDRS